LFVCLSLFFFFFSSRRRHTRYWRDWSSDVCSSDLNGCRAAGPHFIAQSAGKVINISSMLAAVGLPGYTIYSATKGAIIAFTRTRSEERRVGKSVEPGGRRIAKKTTAGGTYRK